MFHLPLLPIGTYLYLFAMHFINVSSFAYFIYTSFLSLNLRTSFFSNYIYFISIHLYVILLSLDLCIFFSISQSIIILILLPLLSMFLYWYLFMLFSMSHSLYVILVSLYYSLTLHISLTLYVPLLVSHYVTFFISLSLCYIGIFILFPNRTHFSYSLCSFIGRYLYVTLYISLSLSVAWPKPKKEKNCFRMIWTANCFSCPNFRVLLGSSDFTKKTFRIVASTIPAKNNLVHVLWPQ